ncbi:hypothetical protein ACFU9Y_04100 [Streptomyces sp. NPDC057621]|uniref:hypothetical protein n=1 Tax=Streptomyces sp. NPDC057621 TaxID=3346186 RepID=UPI003687E42F
MNVYECLVCAEQSETRTCFACRNGIRGDLLGLPELYRALEDSRQRVRGGGSGGRSATRLHAPLPGREDVLNLLGPAARQPVTDGRDQTGAVPFLALLESWAEVVTEGLRLPPVRRHVTPLTARLTGHVAWIVEQDWVADFAEEIRELVRTVERMTAMPSKPTREFLTGVRCPTCDRDPMVRIVPSDWSAECRFCPSVRLDERDYRLLVEAQARDARDAVNP